MTTKAIETEYDGYRFRSRLEARWAVFFNAAGIRYQYEPEGFDVDGVWYLPDFYLPDFDVYCEVKPTNEKLFEDSCKIGTMVDFEGPMSRGLILLGPIPKYRYPEYAAHDMLFWHEGVCVKTVRFKMRRHDHATELITVNPLLDCGGTLEIPSKASVEARIYDESYNGDKDAGLEIWPYKAARQARFEHGERPL